MDMNNYVQHALSLPLEVRMVFVHSLQQGIVDLEPMLWEHQDPEDRRTVYRIIENSRHALQELNYDVLPVYNLNADYEDSPPGYSPFIRLPSYGDTVRKDNEPHQPKGRILKAAKRAMEKAAKKTCQHMRWLYRRVKNQYRPRHGIEGPSPPSLNGQGEAGRAEQQGAAAPGV